MYYKVLKKFQYLFIINCFSNELFLNFICLKYEWK